MNLIFENQKASAAEKDGGFVFQAEISHSLTFYISDGFIVLDPRSSFPFNKNDLYATLHQVDLFPDLNTKSGTATLTYVILSEINLLARKFELAAEKIKQKINPYYLESSEEGSDFEEAQNIPPDRVDAAQAVVQRPDSSQPGTQPISRIQPGGQTALQNPGEINVAPDQAEGAEDVAPPTSASNKTYYADEFGELQKSGKLTRAKRKELNEKYFKGSNFKVTLMTDHIILREISTNSLQGGKPSITLKISTALADEAFGESIDNKEKFSIKVTSSINTDVKTRIIEVTELTLTGEDVIGTGSMIYDEVDKQEEKIFETILPSILLTFDCDSLPVETFTNRSSENVKNKEIYTDLFNPKRKSSEFEPFEVYYDKEDIENKKDTDTEKDIAAGEEIKKLEKKIKYYKRMLNKPDYYKSEDKKRQAAINLENLEKELNSLKGIKESFFIKYQLALLEKRLDAIANLIF